MRTARGELSPCIAAIVFLLSSFSEATLIFQGISPEDKIIMRVGISSVLILLSQLLQQMQLMQQP